MRKKVQTKRPKEDRIIPAVRTQLITIRVKEPFYLEMKKAGINFTRVCRNALESTMDAVRSADKRTQKKRTA